MYLKCKCNKENNAMKTMKYFWQNILMKSQINKKLTKVCYLWGKRISGKVDSHKQETF